MSLKRSNWTNEEVARIIRSRKVSPLFDGEDWARAYNDGLESAALLFEDFDCSGSSYQALSFDTSEGMLVHTGSMLPQ